MRISGGERALGVLSYLAIFFVIPLKVKKDSIFLQFHARQGGVLFGLWLVLLLVFFIVLLLVKVGIVETIMIGGIFLVTGLYALLALIGIFKVLLGERYRMPVVADVALMMGL